MPDLLLPAGARLVHIGPPKTGSTALQVAMSRAREEMATHGAYYPAGPYRRRRAIWALGLPGRPPGMTVPIGHWERLVEEVRAAGDVRACVSDENFGRADSAIAGRIVRDLGRDRVHVVAVARRLDRYLPSKWQERVKWGVVKSFDAWLEDVLGDGPTTPERENAWQGHDLAALVDLWLEHVEPDRFTLVVADESDRDLLPRVLEEMLGLPVGLLAPDPGRSNVSLSWAETELLRSLHAVYARRGWSRRDWGALLPRVVAALRAAHGQQGGSSSPALPAWAYDRARTLSDARVDVVRRLPVRVVGDPESLRVPPRPPGDRAAAPRDVPIDVAVAAVEGAVRAERDRARRRVGEPAGARARSVDELGGRELARLLGRRVARRLRRP